MKHLSEHSKTARILHWLNALSMLILIFSGLYIRWPLSIWFFDTMDQARILHFIFMWLIVWGSAFRIGYAVISGDWQEFVLSRSDIKGIPALIKFYGFLTEAYPFKGKYNPGQKLTYLLFAMLTLAQLITGLMLYKPATFGYLANMLGGDSLIRSAHFGNTIIIGCLAVIHIYLALSSGIDVLKSMLLGQTSIGKERISSD